jgi:hypothetical protein
MAGSVSSSGSTELYFCWTIELPCQCDQVASAKVWTTIHLLGPIYGPIFPLDGSDKGVGAIASMGAVKV